MVWAPARACFSSVQTPTDHYDSGYGNAPSHVGVRRHPSMSRLNMKTKTFDCVRTKRQGAKRAVKQLEGKPFQEQSGCWQKGTEDLKRLQHRLNRTSGRP